MAISRKNGVLRVPPLPWTTHGETAKPDALHATSNAGAAHSPSAAERSPFWVDLERSSEEGGLEEEQDDDELLDELDPGSADLVPGRTLSEYYGVFLRGVTQRGRLSHGQG